MKKEKPDKAEQTANELPAAEVLAQIAAGFAASGDSPDEAIRRAAGLYLRTVDFLNDKKGASREALARACDRELWQRYESAATAKRLDQTLQFDPAKSSDEARHFLAARGLKLKTPRAVLENIREYLRREHIHTFVASVDRKLLGRPDSETLKQRDAALEKIAKRNGWGERQETELQRYFDSMKKGKEFSIPLPVLAGLLEWKKERKHSGGIKSQQAAEK